MHLPLDLRGRVSLLFAGFGALISVVMAVMLYQGAHDLGQRLIDETLTAELDDYIARRERNPASLPPSTVIVQGYVRSGESKGDVPDYLQGLPPGRHDIRLGTLGYRVAILERGGAHYYMLYDTSLQTRREHRFGWMLGLMVIAMTLLSALGGIWISRTVVAPVADLAAKVRHRSPHDWEHPLSEDFPSGEVGELARVFDRHLIRMRAFMERERAFSGDVSHELRTTLAVVLSTTEILLEDAGLSESRRPGYCAIERAARDMAELGDGPAADDARGWLGNGRRVHLATVVREVVDETAPPPRRQGGGRRSDPELQFAVDSGLVKIVASNLIRNAFSYTSGGTRAAGFTILDGQRYRQGHPGG